MTNENKFVPPPAPGAGEPPQQFIDDAIEMSLCSPCQSKRGVVVFRGERRISRGYNFKPNGFACDGSDACKATCRTEAVHAEQMALLGDGFRVTGAELLHVKTVDGALVASGGPSCVQCSKLILAVGIARVWLYESDGWRSYDATEFHRLSLSASSGGAAPREGEQKEEEHDETSAEGVKQEHAGACRPEETATQDAAVPKAPLSEHDALLRLVSGAIRSAIDAHGPIKRGLIGSAAKRVVKQLLASRHGTSSPVVSSPDRPFARAHENGGDAQGSAPRETAPYLLAAFERLELILYGKSGNTWGVERAEAVMDLFRSLAASGGIAPPLSDAPLTVAVENDALVIRLGVHTLAHALTYADWANPYDEAKGDYFRTFAITDAREFAADVVRAIQNEAEDGSSPLTDFLDKMTQAALDDGTTAAEYEQAIPFGSTAPSETWASPSSPDAETGEDG